MTYKLNKLPPTKDYNCRLVYYTAAGHRRTAHCKARAVSHDAALSIAERQLRADKRRSVGEVTYRKAIQQ